MRRKTYLFGLPESRSFRKYGPLDNFGGIRTSYTEPDYMFLPLSLFPLHCKIQNFIHSLSSFEHNCAHYSRHLYFPDLCRNNFQWICFLLNDALFTIYAAYERLLDSLQSKLYRISLPKRAFSKYSRPH